MKLENRNLYLGQDCNMQEANFYKDLNYVYRVFSYWLLKVVLDTMTLEERNVVASKALDYIKKEKLKNTQA